MVNARKFLLALGLLVGCDKSGTVVLHRRSNPPSMYIAKFDAFGDRSLNDMSCEEFRGFVHTMSPETGPVICSEL